MLFLPPIFMGSVVYYNNLLANIPHLLVGLKSININLNNFLVVLAEVSINKHWGIELL